MSETVVRKHKATVEIDGELVEELIDVSEEEWDALEYIRLRQKFTRETFADETVAGIIKRMNARAKMLYACTHEPRLRGARGWL